MPRLHPHEPPYEAEVESALESMMPPGVPPIALFRTLAHSPRVLEKLRHGNLLDRGPVSLRHRELVILRTTARCGSEYEWGVHVSFFAARAGFDAGQVEASVFAAPGAPDEARFAPDECAILRMVDELHDTSRLRDETWATLCEHFSPEQCIELVALTGMYHTVSFFTNAFEVAPETGAARFPERPDPR